jgi:hypothetical protein
MERFHRSWMMADGAPDRSKDGFRMYQPFGKRNAHKASKTIVGLALIILLNFVLYEFRGHAVHDPVITTASQDAG